MTWDAEDGSGRDDIDAMDTDGLRRMVLVEIRNIMPPHLHERREEDRCHFDREEDRAMPFMGRPDITRHLVVRDGDVAPSPVRSIHMGAGPYAFVWGITGENQTHADVDPVAVAALR